MFPSRAFWTAGALLAGSVVLVSPSRAWSAAEVKLDKDFLAGIVEKVPPCPFQKEGHYRGTVQSFRLLAIDPKTRRFEVACQVAGEFRPPLSKPPKDGQSPANIRRDDWISFRFDVRAGVNIEPGLDGTPKFRVDVEEVKRRELEGFAGMLAKVLGKSFDALVKQVVEGRASQLNQRLNAEVLKRVKSFQEYGVFCGIDYTPAQVVLHFDVTRYKSEGIAGHVFPEEHPGTVPLYRWVHRRRAERLYTIHPHGPDPRFYRGEGIAGYVFDRPQPETVPLHAWRGRWDHLYTAALDGEGAYRFGYRPEGIAFYIYPEPKPGTVPLYRFVEPRLWMHLYTTHPHAEFAK